MSPNQRSVVRTLLATASAVAALLAASASPASAYFTTIGGNGTGTGPTATLSSGAISVPASAAGNVTVTWTTQGALSPSVPAQDSSITYKVQRKLGAGAYADITSGGCSGTKAYGTSSCIDVPGVAGAYTYRIVASYQTWTANSADAGPVAVTPDTTAPTVASINRADPSPTNAQALRWTVTFSEPVTGVDTGDFTFAVTGNLTGSASFSVTGSGTTYTYTLTGSSGSGAGTLGLNLVDDDSIADLSANKLGGTGAGNGNFTGQTYTVDRDPPDATITTSAANPNNGSTVPTWTVTFDESVTGVDASDFQLARTGSVSGGAITSVTGSGASYTVTASTTTSGSGSLGLNLLSDGTVKDSVGNVAAAVTGATYTIDRTPPQLVSMSMNDTNANGKVDQIVATFDEPLAASTSNTLWTLANVPSTGTKGALNVTAGSTTATLTITEGAGAANTAVGSFTVALASSATGIKDTLGNQASFAATAPSDGAGPIPISSTNTNGANDGKIEAADTMSVTFSEAIKPASLVAATTVTESRPATGNATLTIPNFSNGARDLGATAYLTAASTSIAFAGTNSLTTGNTVLVITVGACSSGCTNAGQQTTNAAYSYSPATSLTDAAGNAAAGTLSVSTRVF